MSLLWFYFTFSEYLTGYYGHEPNEMRVFWYKFSGTFAPYFREIFGSDFHFSKKEKIDHALEKYGVGREQAFYIGDTVGDIREARAAGVRSVAVTWGWHGRERLAAVNPDFLIDTPEELLAIGR